MKALEASDGWIAKVLKQNNLVSITMHGEVGDMSNKKDKELIFLSFLMLCEQVTSPNGIPV